MPEPYDIALEALDKMRSALGKDATFSGDQIWEYAPEEVPSLRRPSAITKLVRNGKIIATGRIRNAASEKRAGSKTPEYSFPPSNTAPGNLAGLINSFKTDCAPVMALDQLGFTRLVTALLSKKFTILTGLSGSGKTKTAQAIAHWITPQQEWVDSSDHSKGQKRSPYYAIIPVGADWTGNDHVLGYADGLREKNYVLKPALELIISANAPENKDKPHFLILDEMNLSHVERYFADMLSAIESGEPIPLHEGSDWKVGEITVPARLSLPSNLFIIGTVNVDETTYMFSPKVLDRANVIEFRMDPTEIASFLDEPKSVHLDQLDGKGQAFAKAFVDAAGDKTREVPTSVKSLFKQEMLLFFSLLQEHQAEFGYRTSYEAGRFLHFYKELGGFADADMAWFNAAMDAVIVQKLLPKLHGSRPKLEGLLWALANACGADRGALDAEGVLKLCKLAGKAEDDAKYSPESVNAALETQKAKARYPLSFDKVLRMYRKLVRDQFVTFSEA